MKYALTLALGLSATTAMAEVSQADKDAMFGVMQAFGASLETGTAPAFFGDVMYPAVWDRFAQSFGQPTEAFKAQSLAMMGQYYDTLEISEFDVLTDTALFGESQGWSWGVIGARSILSENNGPAEADCVSMLVFGKDGDWFISEAIPNARPLLIDVVPAMQAVDFSYDACDTGGS